MDSADRLVPRIVQQHVEECASLASVRRSLVGAPHVRLRHLRRLDDRLAANLAGLALAGDYGWGLCNAILERAGVGEVFTVAARSIEDGHAKRFAMLLASAQEDLTTQEGLLAGLSWASAYRLRNLSSMMPKSLTPLERALGLAACIAHASDPGDTLARATQEGDMRLRCRALRAAGQSGRLDLRSICVQGLNDGSMDCRAYAAHSAVILGDRSKALKSLRDFALSAGGRQLDALELLIRVVDPSQAAAVLKTLAGDQASARILMYGIAAAGDPRFIPYLISQMSDLTLARLAGESFSTITGADLAWLDLERKPPEGVEFGPNDDPEDDNVAMDEDEGLPWPDPVKVQAWWSASAHRFQPGVRYFMGAPPTWEHCVEVLKTGYQRQRIAAAEYLCLLRPGTMLFNCEAPAWRQQRWLAQV